MQLKVTVRNLESVQTFLRTVPRGGVKIALRAFVEYIIGDARHGLKHDEPYKFASRARAYGKVSDAPEGYFSWKQFRYVAAITKGFTQFGRKHSPTTASESYGARETRNGYGMTIEGNESAYWTRVAQPQQLKNVGWRSLMSVIQSNTKGGIRHAIASINRHFKENSKG